MTTCPYCACAIEVLAKVPVATEVEGRLRLVTRGRCGGLEGRLHPPIELEWSQEFTVTVLAQVPQGAGT